jgi:uncharacterized protein
LEWLRRNMAGWDEKLRMYLFTEEDIVKEENENKAKNSNKEDLGIGKIKKRNL